MDGVPESPGEVALSLNRDFLKSFAFAAINHA